MTDMKLIELEDFPEPDKLPEIWSPDYKEPAKARPRDRVLIVSDGKEGKAIAWIGPGIDYWIDSVGDNSVFALRPGIWVAHVDVQTHYDAWNGDYDIDMTLTEERELTPQEWEMFRETHDSGPWADKDWVNNPICKNDGPDDIPEDW